MGTGQKKRKWTVEQKLEIVHKHLDEHISVKKLEKEYLTEGEAGLTPKPRPSNKFAALYRKKDLSELEYLRLMVAKQEIEIARLKKGTGWKGLVQTRCTLPDKTRIRNHRRTKGEISNRLSLSAHGG